MGNEFQIDSQLRRPIRRLAVVLGDQLDDSAPVLSRLDREQDAVLMMEVDQESRHVPSHKQRTALFLSAMRHFAQLLQEQGYRLAYVRLDDPGSTRSLDGEVRRMVERFSPQSLLLTQPGEWRLLEAARRWHKELPLEVEILPDQHFSCSLEEFEEWAQGQRSLVLERFYRWQRKRLDILVDEQGKPQGGRWNFDKDNRRRFSEPPDPPPPYEAKPDGITLEVIDLVQKRLPDLPGELERFAWPVTRSQALEALQDFTAHRLSRFGPYQDAMWAGQPRLYHSLLSSSLNLKLIRPLECVQAAVKALQRDEAPLQSVEGFVRQIIGWREFVRGVYWQQGLDYKKGNALEAQGTLPEFYWTGETDMACMRDCLNQVIEWGYGHHIQRLMVTGNFALIAGIEPRQVSDWYLGMYVDGVDWVTAPNTLGMSLYADGGVLATKPYAASGRYVQRMSNYCSECRYDPGRRSGSGDAEGQGAACPLTAFYWDFLIRRQSQLSSNPRMALSLRNLDRLPKSEKGKIQQEARRLREKFGIDSPSKS